MPSSQFVFERFTKPSLLINGLSWIKKGLFGYIPHAYMILKFWKNISVGLSSIE
jgi:hypothetical protein